MKPESTIIQQAPEQEVKHLQPHPVTQENSPEETIKRMRALTERAVRLKEAIRAARETHAR